MTEESYGSTNRVITIVQSSLPISAATALDGDQTGEIDGLPHQDKNPFSTFSEEHLSRLDDFLSTEEAQKILQQTTVEPFNNTEVISQGSQNESAEAIGQGSQNDSDVEVTPGHRTDLLNIFDNKTEDHTEVSSHVSDHAYAIPVKRVTRASLPVTSPVSLQKRGPIKDEAMIVADVGNMVEISAEDSKPGKGRGRGRKSQGEIPLGNDNSRRSSRISDNEQREMAEKIRQENLQKEKEEMEALNTGQFTDSQTEDNPKKKGRGRPRKTGNNDLTGDDEDESEDEEAKNSKTKGKAKTKKAQSQESDSEDEGSPRGHKARSKSRTKKQDNDEKNDKTTKKKKGKKLKGKKSDGSLSGSPKKLKKKMKGKKTAGETESEDQSPARNKKKKLLKKKAKKTESESEVSSPTKGKLKKGKKLMKKEKLKSLKKKKEKDGKLQADGSGTDIDKKGIQKKKLKTGKESSEKDISDKKKADDNSKSSKQKKTEIYSSEDDEPLSAMTEKKVETKDSGASKNIFDALNSVMKTSSPLKRKSSEVEKGDNDAKKKKSDSMDDASKRTDSEEIKPPKSVKKKFRKSEDFLDMTMTDLFKPDRVIKNEDEHKHELPKISEHEEKHNDDSVSSSQENVSVNVESAVETNTQMDTADKKINEIDQIEITEDTIKESEIEEGKCSVDQELKTDQVIEKLQDDNNENSSKDESVDSKIDVESNNQNEKKAEVSVNDNSESECVSPEKKKEDENLKIKAMYKKDTEKVDDLNSSIDSNVGSISVSMATSDNEDQEPICFEATIENVNLENLPLSVHLGQGQTESETMAVIENVTMDSDFNNSVKETDKTEEESKSMKIAPNKAKSKVQKKETEPKVKGKTGQVSKVISDVDTSDVTGSEEEGRVMRRRRALNPLVQEFLKKEKGRRKKMDKSEDEEPEKEVIEKKKKTNKQEKKPKKVKEVEKSEPETSEVESEEESEEDVSSGEEYEPPDKKYCICNKPYDNKFMICCDKCENWYHGKCIGISRARGKEMEDNQEEYICDRCKDPDKGEKPKAKPEEKTMVVKMPGLLNKKEKSDKKKQSQTEALQKKTGDEKPSAKKKLVDDKLDTQKKEMVEKVKVKGATDGKTTEKLVVEKTSAVDDAKKLEEATKKPATETGNKAVKIVQVVKSPNQALIDQGKIKIIKLSPTKPSADGKPGVIVLKQGSAVTPGKPGNQDKPGSLQKSATPGKTDKVGDIFTPDKVTSKTKKSTETKKEEPQDKVGRCIGPKCGKPARSDSVYCSNECIINHSKDSLNIIHSQQEVPIKLSGDKRIVVIEKTTGKILTGDKAPKESELCSWLEKNPSYSVLCPTLKKAKQDISGTNKEEDKQQQKDSHHSNKDHHHSNKDHNKDQKRRDSSQEHRKSHSDSSKDKKRHGDRKSSDKHSSHRSGSSGKKDERKDHHHKSDHRKDDRKDSSKTEKKDESKSDTKGEDAGPDPVRLNVRKSLRDALVSRAEKADDVLLSLSEIKSLALEIENELFAFFKDSGHKYKNKYRSLIFNIKDSKNKGLFRKILNGDLKPAKLVRMTPEELASRELAKWREFETKHEIDLIVQQEKTSNVGVHLVKKTHKGEEILDKEEQDLSTLEDHGVDRPKPNIKANTEKTAVDFIGGLIGDTTSQHKNHLFDLNCRICTGKEAPPMKDTTPKKVRVAHSVKTEEASSSEKKVRIKTDDEKKKEDDIVKEVLKAVQKAKKEQMEEEAKREREQKVVKTPETPEIVADSTVIVRSPDSALQSGLEQKPDFTPKGPQVWKGFISMQDVAKFVTTAYKVSGPSDKLNIPDTINVCGRISPDQVFDYLAKMRKVGTKDIIVLRFIPGPNEEKTSYINLYSYLNSRSRCGVVGSVSKYIKDFYILPLASHSKIPTVIRPFVEQGLEKNRPHMLLAVIVRQKLKAHGVEIEDKAKQKHVEKVKQKEKRPYTPPGQKSYGPLPKIPKKAKTGSDMVATATVTMTTTPTTRGSSDDPIVAVYGKDTGDDDVEPYDPEKPTLDSKPQLPDDLIFKKPTLPVPRASPSSSPGAAAIKTVPGAASLVTQMMEKLRTTSNASSANDVISEGLSPMATVTDKQKLLLELTQRVCEQKKLIELKHAGKSVQEANLPLIAVANAMTAISQISKTLVSAPKKSAIATSQGAPKTVTFDKNLVTTSVIVTSSTTEENIISSGASSSDSESTVVSSSESGSNMSVSSGSVNEVQPKASEAGVSGQTNEAQPQVSKQPGFLPHEIAEQSEKMSTMPEALKSLFSSIPGSYSHVTKYAEAVPKKPEVTTSQVSESSTTQASTTQSESSADSQSNEGKGQFNMSLLAFDYGDSDEENDEIKASASGTPTEEESTRPSSVMSSTSEESQDSANIAPLQYPPLPDEPAMPPPLPEEPPPPPPDHDPEEEKEEDKSEEEETGGTKKGKKKKKKKKKDRKGKPAPEIILEAKDPISKAILDASFRRLMEGQQDPMVPMSPVVPMSGPVTGPVYQNPNTGPGLMGPSPSTKPALLPTPVLNPPQMVAPMVMPQGPPMSMPQAMPMQPNVAPKIPSLLELDVKPSENLELQMLGGEPENELDQELRDLAKSDWQAPEESDAQDLDLRQDQDLRMMDVDMRQSAMNIPPVIPTQVQWPEDVDHRKGGRYTPDPVFGSNINLPSEDSDLRNFCSPLDQDYRRLDQPQDQDFRVGGNRHDNHRGSHDHGRDNGRRRRHEDSSHRKSKRRRRDDDRHHSRYDEDRDHRHRDSRSKSSETKYSDSNSEQNVQDSAVPQDVDQRQNVDKIIPPPPRLADRVPVPPPQVLAKKAASELLSSVKMPPLQPPPLPPPGLDVKPLPSVSAPPAKPSQPPPPGIDDW